MPPEPRLLSEVADAIRGVGSRGQWEALQPRIRKLAARALWIGQPEPIRTRGVLGAVRDEAKSTRGSGRLRSMIGSYLCNFDPHAAGFAQYAAALREVLAARRDSCATSWRARDGEFALFSPAEGPRRLAARLLAADRPADELDLSGLAEASLAVSSFAEAVQKLLCRSLGQRLYDAERADALDRLRPVLEAPDGSLRIPGRAAYLADDLLQPWASGRKSASAALRDALTRFLLLHLGDPRLKDGNWRGVSRDSQGLFRRWLARESLDEFFEFISDRADSHQWPYRRAFWRALAGKGVIEDSWVVLNKSGFQLAKRKLASERGIACGKLANHSTQDQSIILLRARGLVFAEVSHNGALHAWRKDDPVAPPFAKSEYLWEDLYRPGLDFPDSPHPHCLWHQNPQGGLWQRRAADLLRRETGIVVSPSDWTP